MSLWLVPLLPLAVGVATPMLPLGRWGAWSRWLAGVLVTVVTTAMGLSLRFAAPRASFAWGSRLTLQLEVLPEVAVMVWLVPVVALPVLIWAVAHEELHGMARLLGGLMGFLGAMALLVLAADFLTLLVGWELSSACSFALIGHRHRERGAVRAAGYAYITTRLGGLGLVLAAGACLAATQTLGFDAVPQVVATSWGPLFTGSIVWAAASKSAQVPFSPWLFAAMHGPSSVSALLHSSTMVAAGAWLLIRLQPGLDAVPWFGPTVLALGLLTAWAGGLVACLQPHAKRLLAASSSAQFGLVFVAVGAGAPLVGLLHLVAHATVKALLFLVAGTAMAASGTAMLHRMRAGRRLPGMAVASGLGALALAGVPPLGLAWTKEHVVTAAGYDSVGLALLVLGAGGLASIYATRFQLLAYGRPTGPQAARGGAVSPFERLAAWALVVASVIVSLLWLPGGQRLAAAFLHADWPDPHAWEIAVSWLTVGIGVVLTRWIVGRAGRASGPGRAVWSDWLGLPRVLDLGLVRPLRRLSLQLARFDDRVVDGGVRLVVMLGRRARRIVTRGLEALVEGAVWLTSGLASVSASSARDFDEEVVDGMARGVAHRIDVAGSLARRLQTGAVPTYYAVAMAFFVFSIVFLALWR